MRSYFDTCVLVKLYCSEKDSARAASIASRCDLPLIFVTWQQLELRNALRLKVFRKELRIEECAMAFGRISEDLTSGVLAPVSVDHEEVFSVAEELSSRWTGIAGCRTLDVLHVAAAKVIQADSFVTFDRRQADLAANSGLNVINDK